MPTISEIAKANEKQLKNRAYCIIEHREYDDTNGRRKVQRLAADGEPLRMVIRKESAGRTAVVPEAYRVHGWVEVKPAPKGVSRAKKAEKAE